MKKGEMFMRLEGESYSRRLREYTDSTIQLIIDTDGISKEVALKASDITTDSELTEEEVVRQLQELKKSYLTTTETK